MFPGLLPLSRVRKSVFYLTRSCNLDTNVLAIAMPVNPQHLHESVRRVTTKLVAASHSLEVTRTEALRLLELVTAEPGPLAEVIAARARADPNLRCAVPLQESVSASIACPPGPGAPALLAADGSQIQADRHEEILFALINVGSVCIKSGSGLAPEITVSTRLLFDDELYSADDRLLSEGDLALMRDVAERRSLLADAPEVPGLIAVGDGPLELWGAKDLAEPHAYEQALHRYLDDLRAMKGRGFTVAGYVDKPAADLVIHMLELSVTSSASGTTGTTGHRLRGVSDLWLFGSLLQPGHRSAVFGLQSASRQRYPDELAIDFFYVNVGHASRPAIARVEIPRWITVDPPRVAVLHQTLLSQCALMGARPYPYILHRAHETARITDEDKNHVKLRLLLEMRNHGLEPGTISGKSAAKALPGFRGRS